MALFHYVVKCNQPETMDYLDFWKLWQSETEGALAGIKAGKILAQWKVASQNIVIGVGEADSHEEINLMFYSLPMFKKIPGNIEMEILPVIPYETWVSHLDHIVDSLEQERK